MRFVFVPVLAALGVVFFMGAVSADDTAACDRSSSLGAAVDGCPTHVNPCCLERVDTGTTRYEIMRDSSPSSPASVLIVALSEIDGTTSREYSSPPVIDFWSEGSKAAQRYLPAETRGDPPIALAMNAGPTRGEHRIHLHISCASPKLLAALQGHTVTADAWTPIELAGIAALHVPDRTFRVRFTPALVDDTNAAAPPRNPFSLAIAGVATPDLQNHGMAIVEAPNGGWYVIDRTVAPSDLRTAGYVEDMLEETCGGRALRL